MDANNIFHFLRTLIPHQPPQNNNTQEDTHNENDDDMPPLEPIVPTEQLDSPDADVHMATPHDNDVDSMPDLQSVTNSSDSESDSDSQDDDDDRDANEVVHVVEDDDHDDSWTDDEGSGSGDAQIHLHQDPDMPPLEPLEAPIRNNRRARVEDDEDDERDRRHPSQRTNAVDNVNANFFDNNNNPGPRVLHPVLPPFGLPAFVRTGPGVGGQPQAGQGVNPTPFRLFQHFIPRVPANNAANNNPDPNNPNPNPNANANPNPNANPAGAPAPGQPFIGGVAITIDIGPGPPLHWATPIHGPAQGQTQPHAHGHPHPPQFPLPPFPLPPNTHPHAHAHAVPVDMTMFADVINRLGALGQAFGIAREDEPEDPERARRLVDGLEVVDVGLVRRLERVGDVGGGGGGEGEGVKEDVGGSGGDSGCAICWDRLLDGEGEMFGGGEAGEGQAEGQGDVPADADADVRMASPGSSSTPLPSEPPPSHTTTTTIITLSSPSTTTSPTTTTINPTTSTSHTSFTDSSFSHTNPSNKTHPKIVSLPCAHVFHASCLIPWFSRPRQTTCPTCRFNIDPENLTFVRRRRVPANPNPNPAAANPGAGAGAGGANPAADANGAAGDAVNPPPHAQPLQTQVEGLGNAANAVEAALAEVRARVEAASARVDALGAALAAVGHGVGLGRGQPQQEDDDGDDEGPPPLEPINMPIAPAIDDNPTTPLPSDEDPALPTFDPEDPPVPALPPQPTANQDDNPTNPTGNNNPAQQQFMTFGFDVIIPGPEMNAEMMEEMAGMNEQEQREWMDEQLLFEDDGEGMELGIDGMGVDMRGMEGNQEQFAQMFGAGGDGQNGNVNMNMAGIPPQFAQMFAGFGVPQPPPAGGNAAPNANANGDAGNPPPAPPFPAQFTQMFGGFGVPPTGPAGANNNNNNAGGFNGFQMFRDFLPQPPPPPPAAGAEGAVPNLGTGAPPAPAGADPVHPPNPFADLLRGFGIPLIVPGGAPGRARPPREKKAWTLPPAPGLTLRQRVERKEREAGLRCCDVSCGVGPSDEEPFVDISAAAMKQVSIRTLKSVNAGGSRTGDKVCEHTFHPSCLVSAERVQLAAVGAEETVEDGEVVVSCPVCRAEGCVSKEEWEEGVKALL